MSNCKIRVKWMLPSASISGALGLEHTLITYGRESVSGLTTLIDLTGATSGFVARQQIKAALPVAAAMTAALQFGYLVGSSAGAIGDVLGEDDSDDCQ